MSSVEQKAGSGEQVATRQQSPGTASLVLGALAIAMIVLPALPTPVPMWIRLLLLYSVVPLAISAVVSGMVALRRMRGREEADRFRARSGVALGTMVVVILLGVVVWGIWALEQAYS
jgi:class 3 adenylate cyclase